MNWLITVLAGWTVVACILGLLVGRGIRIERGAEPECRSVPESSPAGHATGALPHIDTGSSRTGDSRGPTIRVNSLTGVR
jgi:hypothetical protein